MKRKVGMDAAYNDLLFASFLGTASWAPHSESRAILTVARTGTEKWMKREVMD